LADVRKEVESLLFASGRAMLVKDLADIIQAKQKDVEKAIHELKADFDSRDTSMTLMETPDGWKMNVKGQYVSLVTKIVADTELPFPLLETLSVIAYKAPAWQAEVIKTRGTNAYEHIQQLIDGGFVDRRKKGRSFELVLTPKFFEYFDVEGDKNLKMLFKDVKPSEPAPKRKKLGDLPVVDVPVGEATPAKAPTQPTQEQKAPQLGELDVVDIPRPHVHKPQFKPDNDFLEDIDSRIDDLSKRNDDLEQDEMFQKPDESGAGENPEDADTFEPGENKKMRDIFGGEDEPKKIGEDADVDELVAEGTKSKNSEDEDKPKDPLAEDEDKIEI